MKPPRRLVDPINNLHLGTHPKTGATNGGKHDQGVPNAMITTHHSHQPIIDPMIDLRHGALEARAKKDGN
jgi:hypothetical protein